MHPGAIGVEYPRHPHVDPRLLVVGVGQGLRHPLALVVARPWSDGVHVTPVTFRLGMNLWVTINLRKNIS